jgi:hypothetical protein
VHSRVFDKGLRLKVPDITIAQPIAELLRRKQARVEQAQAATHPKRARSRTGQQRPRKMVQSFLGAVVPVVKGSELRP